MAIALVSVIISFLLDGLLSNYFNFSLINPSLFKTIYTIIALVVILPYFNNDKKYLYILFGTAILFDIVYTNTFILNIVLFFLIYILNKFLDFFMPHNLLNSNIRSILSVTLYYILTFIILNIVKYNEYSLSLLLNIITHSIIMTIIYTTILYLLTKYLYGKFNIKQIR